MKSMQVGGYLSKENGGLEVACVYVRLCIARGNREKMGRWDLCLKLLLRESPQDFVDWLLIFPRKSGIPKEES